MSELIVGWEPTRAAGLERLAAFLPRAGRHYARDRNKDLGAGAHQAVSGLSPYLRHRLVLEREVLERVGESHAGAAAEKFISEVFWRTYFKGYLERRPTIWQAYKRDRDATSERVASDPSLSRDIAAAEAGRTGIDCFDHWAGEIVDTGYLHNHARMWFASIWIFTLRLPWQLGADFFLRNLLDGDAASNTLSWRWVAGLHTKGRTYLARPDNIARNTLGRFAPKGLAGRAPALVEEETHPLQPVPRSDPPSCVPHAWLLTEEDCSGEAPMTAPEAIVPLCVPERRSPVAVSSTVCDFAREAVRDAVDRQGLAERPRTLPSARADALVDQLESLGVENLVTHYVPQGPARDLLDEARPALAARGIALTQVLRPEDAAAWVHATAGFFRMRKAIGSLMAVGARAGKSPAS